MVDSRQRDRLNQIILDAQRQKIAIKSDVVLLAQHKNLGSNILLSINTNTLEQACPLKINCVYQNVLHVITLEK